MPGIGPAKRVTGGGLASLKTLSHLNVLPVNTVDLGGLESLPTLDTPEALPVNTVKLAALAYNGSQVNAVSTTSLQSHRWRRGFPYQRGGQYVPAVPQFKGLTLHTNVVNQQTPAPSVIPVNGPPSGFRQTSTQVRVRWPIANLKTTTT
jgi:hypothetical protein